MTCWIPSFSTRPGGKMRLANARRKMALNSVSRPPIPMSSNLKLGAKMALGGALRTSDGCESQHAVDYRTMTHRERESKGTHFFELDLILMALAGSLTKLTSVWLVRMPLRMLPPPFLAASRPRLAIERTVARRFWP